VSISCTFRLSEEVRKGNNVPHYIPDDGPTPDPKSTTYVREVPRASSIWLHAALAVLPIAATVVLAALTVNPESAISLSLLLFVVAGFCIAITVIFLLSHWDTNRGRNTRAYEIRKK
jgi:hypothetical protein